MATGHVINFLGTLFEREIFKVCILLSKNRLPVKSFNIQSFELRPSVGGDATLKKIRESIYAVVTPKTSILTSTKTVDFLNSGKIGQNTEFTLHC